MTPYLAMNLIDPYAKKDEIYGAETYHRESGYFNRRREKYQKALKYFDEAIKVTPGDKRALMGRSKCRAKVSQYEGALEDIKKCDSLYPDDIPVLASKAHDTYLCSEFEEGLVQNVRLIARCHKPGKMDPGRMECVEAIENSIGDRAGQPMLDHFKIIRKLGWKWNNDAQKPFEPTPTNKPKEKLQFFKEKFQKLDTPFEPVQPRRLKKKKSHSSLLIKDSLHSGTTADDPVPPYIQSIPFKPLQNYTSNIENYMAEKYLDTMYQDQIFLKNLVHEPRMYCPSNESTKKLRDLAKNCYKNIFHKQELLRHRRPFYFIRYNDAKTTGQLQQRQKIELEHQQKMVRKEAESILENMITALKSKRLQDFLAFSEQLRRYCDGKPKRLLPNKEYYTKVIIESVGQAFYDVYRINPQQSMFDQHKRIYVILGLPLGRYPSTDSVVKEFKTVWRDHNAEIRKFEERLANATTSQEVCWFYHELSRLHLKMKHFDLSQLYAKKCIQEATSIDNKKWIINSLMLMCKSDLAQHNKNDAILELRRAIKYAETLEDKGKIDFFMRCIDIVTNVEFIGEFGIIQTREKSIVRLMQSQNIKSEMESLFKAMATMPISRRMTVAPGMIMESQDTRNSIKGRKSIMPAQKGLQLDSLADLKQSAAQMQSVTNLEEYLV